jgi:hypothetical protein
MAVITRMMAVRSVPASLPGTTVVVRETSTLGPKAAIGIGVPAESDRSGRRLIVVSSQSVRVVLHG